jgi:hypothetical protein
MHEILESALKSIAFIGAIYILQIKLQNRFLFGVYFLQ